MTTRLTFLAIFCLACPIRNAFGDEAALRHMRQGDDSIAAIVAGSAPLVHTSQIFAVDAKVALASLDDLLRASGGDAGRIVKLNVSAATQAHADAAREAIREKFPADNRPPVSFVVGALPKSDAAVGVDAVVLATAEAFAPLAGPRVYISGQAEPGASPADAAAKTLASLMKTIEFVGSKPVDVVQVKCFLTPMSAAPQVTAEIAKVFGARRVPVVLAEWKSDLPVEIEFIAAAPPAAGDAPAIEYLTPPGMTASPLFARIVRINRGDIVYTAGLYSKQPGTAEQQVMSIFEQLRDVTKQAGTDMKHLAKATYFVGDGDAGASLNAIRPKFYDPQRPPAASKVMVPGVGAKDRSIGIDMIGIIVAPSATAPAQTR